MTASKVGIIYGVNSKQIREIIHPDDDAQLLAWRLHPNERMLTVDQKEYDQAQGYAPATLVANYTGVTPSSPRHAVVDAATGKVTAVLNADPDIDAISGKTLVAASDAVTTDWTWTQAKGFVAPPKIVPKVS